MTTTNAAQTDPLSKKRMTTYDNAGRIQSQTNRNGDLTTLAYSPTSQLKSITYQDASQVVFTCDSRDNLATITNQNRQIVNSYAYDPYGKLMAQTETITQPFKYAGQFGVHAEENNLYYMRARYYDADIGRFISEDPIGFEGGD